MNSIGGGAQICNKSDLPTSQHTRSRVFDAYSRNANDAGDVGNNGAVSNEALTPARFGNLTKTVSFSSNGSIVMPSATSVGNIETGRSMSAWLIMDDGMDTDMNLLYVFDRLRTDRQRLSAWGSLRQVKELMARIGFHGFKKNAGLPDYAFKRVYDPSRILRVFIASVILMI